MPCVCDVTPILDVDNIIEVLTTQLQDLGNGALYCPRVAPTRGIVSCTYEQWFRPYSLRRCYCHLPVSGRRMQRFLQFRLGCHCLPIATGRFAGAAHVDRAQRVCLSCNAGALGDEKHLIFECTALASLRSRYAGLFTSSTDTMRSFFAQPDRMGGFPLCHRLSGFYEDLNMIAIIGTSDRPCWLAEACKILLLLLLKFMRVMLSWINDAMSSWHLPPSIFRQTSAASIGHVITADFNHKP